MKKKLSKETWLILETEHLKNKLSLKEICLKYSMCYTTVYYGFKRLGIPITIYGRDKRLHDINDNYFKHIDSEDKAYILGLLASDGYIKDHTVCLKLKEEDYDTIEYVRNQLSIMKPIYLDRNNTNGKIFLNYKIEISSEIMCKDLENLGIIKRKTGNERFPELRDDLYCHFVRGYFDGDGSVSKTTKGPAKSYQFYICCTNKQFLLDLQKHLGFGKVYTEKRPTIDMHTFRTTSLFENVSLVKYMYQHCKSHYMKRKAIRCVDYVNIVLRHCSNVQCNA